MFKQILKRASQGLMLVPLLALGASIVGPHSVLAAGTTDVQCGVSNSSGLGTGSSDPLTQGSQCAKGNGQGTDLNNVFKTVANIMLFLVGAIAVIMLIVGGLRYVTSGGDQTAVTSAKNTILYAIVGIVVAFLAFAAVNFVTGQLAKSNA